MEIHIQKYGFSIFFPEDMLFSFCQLVPTVELHHFEIDGNIFFLTWLASSLDILNKKGTWKMVVTSKDHQIILLKDFVAKPFTFFFHFFVRNCRHTAPLI